LRESNLSSFGTPLWESQDEKAIWMRALWRGANNTIWGKVVASPESGPWWVLWVQSCLWLVLAPKVLQHNTTMKKYWVLQLGLQLGSLNAMDTCNSWYIYNFECFRTSCSNYSNCNEHPMLDTILYIWCNSHATTYNFFVTNLHVRFPHTFQCSERITNVAFHPFVDEWRMLIPFATYLQLFYNWFDEYNF